MARRLRTLHLVGQTTPTNGATDTRDLARETHELVLRYHQLTPDLAGHLLNLLRSVTDPIITPASPSRHRKKGDTRRIIGLLVAASLMVSCESVVPWHRIRFELISTRNFGAMRPIKLRTHYEILNAFA